MYYHVQACGAKYRIQEEDIDETDVDDVVVALVNMARRVSSASIRLIKTSFLLFLIWLMEFLCGI